MSSIEWSGPGPGNLTHGQRLVRFPVEVILVDPGTMPRNGRPKTDVHDCQWIQRLHTLGLLTAAFRPDDPVVVLRCYLRLRLTLLAGTCNTCRKLSRR